MLLKHLKTVRGQRRNGLPKNTLLDNHFSTRPLLRSFSAPPQKHLNSRKKNKKHKLGGGKWGCTKYRRILKSEGDWKGRVPKRSLPRKTLQKSDLALPFFEGSLPSYSLHSAGYTRTFLHPYFPASKQKNTYIVRPPSYGKSLERSFCKYGGGVFRRPGGKHQGLGTRLVLVQDPLNPPPQRYHLRGKFRRIIQANVKF